MIEVNHLVKDYGGHHAVNDISFTVDDGQIVGLLGPNGAGKSTTMNIMTGYISATSGSVKIGDYDILEQPLKAKRLLGYLPEIPPVYEEMTVDEYLDFAGGLKGMKKKERKKAAAQAKEAVRIEDVGGRLIKNLSKGYKQRVGLAQALLGEPPLLILDEPTVGLDPNQIMEIRTLIRSLAKKHTIILSSHILSEVNAICDYVLIIDQGKLVAQDTPENLSRHFADKNRIILSVKGDRTRVEEALEEAEWIETWQVTGEEDGVVDITAETNTTKDIRDALFFAFADKKLAIVKMETEVLSLEEVFMKLTGEHGQEAGDEAEGEKTPEKEPDAVKEKEENNTEENNTEEIAMKKEEGEKKA